MEKYTLDEGISALDRVKLLMSYRESMTLRENIEVIEEQKNQELTDSQMQDYVNKAVNLLDGFVSGEDLVKLGGYVAILSVKSYKEGNALIKFLEYYKIDEGGDDFLEDVKSVGERTIGIGGVNAKNNIIKLVEDTIANPEVKILWPPCVAKFETKKDSEGVEYKLGRDGLFYYKDFRVINPNKNQINTYRC